MKLLQLFFLETKRYFTLHEDCLAYYDAAADDETLYTSDYENVFIALDAFLDLKDKFEKITDEEITIIDAEGNVLEDEEEEETIFGDDPTKANLEQEETDYTEEEKKFLELCKQELGGGEDDKTET